MAEAPGAGQGNGLLVKTGVMFQGCLRVRSIQLLPGAPAANSRLRQNLSVLLRQGQSPSYCPMGISANLEAVGMTNRLLN